MRLADRLGIDRECTSDTYYACLLSHAGCTTEAHVAAEVFGGSLTTSFGPLMYGSAREVLTGLLRALPDPDSPALVRTLQTARRLPRMARETRPALTRGLRGRGDAGRSSRRACFGAGPPCPCDRAMGRSWPAAPGQGGTDPCADADRPRRDRRRLPASPWRGRARGEPRAQACRPRLRPGGSRLSRGRRFEGPRTRAECLRVGGGPRLRAGPPLVLEADALDRALAAMGNFADLISPYLGGHSQVSPISLPRRRGCAGSTQLV